MIVSFSGWMNGGEASTGTVDYIINQLGAVKFAEIKPDPFYIFSFPGNMEQVNEFRPYIRIKEGILQYFSFPKNEFYYQEKNNLILFRGKEPHIHWQEYTNSIFKLGKIVNLKKIFFIGSVAAATPHTRGIRTSCYCSRPGLKKELNNLGVKLTSYEGPGSITTYLTYLAPKNGIDMINLVAEIPIYIQSENPKAIKTMTEKLAKLLNLPVDTSDLNKKNLAFEKKINQLLENQPQLADEIKKLEENYDKEFFDRKGGFEEWLKRKGIDKL
jgi:proteasome assembly chaperone (PAC2) family protein